MTKVLLDTDTTALEALPISTAAQAALAGKPTIYTGTTTTAAATAAKVVNLDAPFAAYTPVAGDYFRITYTGVSQTASSATLNINGSGAANVRLANANANNVGHTTASGGNLLYFYDGTFYHLVGSQQQINTTYTEISEAEITAGTASTARSISGRRSEFIVTKARQGMLDYLLTSEASSATPTVTGTALRNDYVATALVVNATLAAPSGTANDNAVLRYRITASGGTRTIGYNAALLNGGLTRPTSIAAGETMTQIYERVGSTWSCVHAPDPR